MFQIKIQEYINIKFLIPITSTLIIAILLFFFGLTVNGSNLLNHLMNHAGELVLNRNQLLQILNRKASDIIDFSTVFSEIDKIVTECKAATNTIEFSKATSKIDALKNTVTNATSHQVPDYPGIAAITQNLDRVTTNLQEQIIHQPKQLI